MIGPILKNLIVTNTESFGTVDFTRFQLVKRPCIKIAAIVMGAVSYVKKFANIGPRSTFTSSRLRSKLEHLYQNNILTTLII